MEGLDLSGYNADDHSGFADFEQDDTLPGADHQTANDPQWAGVAEGPPSIEAAKQVGAQYQQADDHCQTEQHLNERPP